MDEQTRPVSQPIMRPVERKLNKHKHKEQKVGIKWSKMQKQAYQENTRQISKIERLLETKVAQSFYGTLCIQACTGNQW